MTFASLVDAKTARIMIKMVMMIVRQKMKMMMARN